MNNSELFNFLQLNSKLKNIIDLIVYTWGEGKRGQLGHGETENWREFPEPVEALRGKSIHR